jgi:hypothetical protein
VLSRGADREVLWNPDTRTMFAIYVVVITAGLALYITVGLAHL